MSIIITAVRLGRFFRDAVTPFKPGVAPRWPPSDDAIEHLPSGRAIRPLARYAGGNLEAGLHSRPG